MDDALPPNLLRLGSRLVDLTRRRIESAAPPGASIPCGGEHLTRTEAAILRLLAARAPATVTREELLRSLWNLASRSSRTLDTHVTRLRRKLEDDPAAPHHLLTVYRVGYRLELPTSAPPMPQPGTAAATPPPSRSPTPPSYLTMQRWSLPPNSRAEAP